MRLLIAQIIDRKETDYPQLWYHMPRKRNYPRLRRFLQWGCGLLGHELSKTEWGYGGGKYADRWCRWCDKIFSVPVESLGFEFESFREMKPIIKQLREKNHDSTN